jgi:hypothetical protein
MRGGGKKATIGEEERAFTVAFKVWRRKVFSYASRAVWQ